MIRIYSALTVLFLLFSTDSFSLSCAPLQYKIFVKCENSNCENIFFINEISTGPGCARRPVIDVAPGEMKEILKFELEVGKIKFEDGISILTFNKHFLFEREEYLDNYKKFRKMGSKSRAFLDSFSRPEIQDPVKLRQHWNDIVTKHYRSYLLSLIFQVLGVLLALITLIYSIINFNRWLKTRSRKDIVVSIVLQGALFSCIFFVNLWVPPLFIIISVLVPLVWLYQLVHYLVLIIRRKF